MFIEFIYKKNEYSLYFIYIKIKIQNIIDKKKKVRISQKKIINANLY